MYITMWIEWKQINEDTNLQKQEISQDDALNKWLEQKIAIDDIKELERVENIILGKIEKWDIFQKDWNDINIDNVALSKIESNLYTVNLDDTTSNFPEMVINSEWEKIRSFVDIYNDKSFNIVVESTWITEEKRGNEYVYMKNWKEISLIEAYWEYKRELIKITLSDKVDGIISFMEWKINIIPTKEELTSIIYSLLDNMNSNYIMSNTDENIDNIIISEIKNYVDSKNS